MRRRWHLPGALVALMAFAVTLSCDRPQSGGSPLEPQVTGDLLGLPGLNFSRPQPLPGNLRWVTESDPGDQRFASELIGILGGVLGLDTHAVVVPRGAVLQTTLFTAYAPATSVIDVDLHAYVGNLLSGVLRLLGLFEKPVTLELSYARATNIGDPDHLVIVRLLPDGSYEILPTTVDKQRKVVRAQLDHFSKYAMASN
jgi:hypothetical protein